MSYNKHFRPVQKSARPVDDACDYDPDRYERATLKEVKEEAFLDAVRRHLANLHNTLAETNSMNSEIYGRVFGHSDEDCLSSADDRYCVAEEILDSLDTLQSRASENYNLVHRLKTRLIG